MASTILKRWISASGLLLGAAGFAGLAMAQDPAVRFADQGPEWTPELRAAFYVQDQGSQMIPLAWFKALRQADGKPFNDGALARYGYLPNPSPLNLEGLPVGFTLANAQEGPMVGMTCAACHTRQITVDATPYRIDGGPAFADFQSFVVDLDDAMRRALASGEAFQSFAQSVLGVDANKPDAVTSLHEQAELWSLRFHMLISRSIPVEKPWGPARLDAIAMIYNRLNGLDLGPAPDFIIADNMAVGDAPARYPFLWNAWRQDKTQWGAWAGNGNSSLAIARNLGQVIGVFASFHPLPKTDATPLDRDYLSANSANASGLAMAEGMLARLAPPVWPFPFNHALAERGYEIFNRPTASGGCVECHGIAEGEARPPNLHTWKTPAMEAGTDIRQWQVVLRSARTGTLEGATIPGIAGPLKATDLSLNILKAVVTGTLVEIQAAQAAAQNAPAMPKNPMVKAGLVSGTDAGAVTAMTHDEMQKTMSVLDMPAKEDTARPGSMPSDAAPPGTFVYEARVLQGIWAAAPYLHNGSVPTLVQLLTPPAQRVKQFKVGPAYDTKAVGLAEGQAGSFTLTVTGCEDKASGNSNCGHDYGTQLPADEKAALLEYLKTL